MTLRTRLTAAFLAVVLGPVVLGAVSVGATATAVNRDQEDERLRTAAAALTSAVGALCERARAAAEVLAATVTRGVTAASAARIVVARDLSHAALVENHRGLVTGRAGGLPGSAGDARWLDCARPEEQSSTLGGTADGVVLVGSTVELRRPNGALAARARAAFALTPDELARLAAGVDVGVTILAGERPAASTLARADALAVSRAAAQRDGRTESRRDGQRESQREGRREGERDGEREARRDGRAAGQAGDPPQQLRLRVLEPSAGQPVRAVLSVPGADLGGLYLMLLVVTVLVAAAAVAVAGYLARTLTRPLAEVVQAAERVAAGDLAARVPVRGRDEAGRLASTFNRMTRETQAYVAALTASRDQLRGTLGLLGETLSSTHDLGRILEVILESVVSATGAEAGVVLLAERCPQEWPGVLVGQCGHGMSARGVDVTAVRVRIGEGLLGGVAASGEPRLGRVGADGEFSPGQPLAPGEPPCRTYIAVPFTGSGRVLLPTASAGGDAVNGSTAGTAVAGPLLGVLALYDRLGADDFDDGDITTLRSFAGQAAIAVENVLLHREAERVTLTDPLTGLWNVRYLDLSLHREIERAVRFGRPLSVLTVDLDRFAEVNETLGAAAGDAVLAEVARRLVDVVREVDMVFRRGGEEFVLVLPETGAEGAARVAERICTSLRTEPVRLGADPQVLVARCTASVGVAVHPDDGSDPTVLLERADDARYAAKAAGRDGWRMASSVREPRARSGQAG